MVPSKVAPMASSTLAHGVQTSLDDLGTPLSEVTFVVVDLETAGGRPDAEGITEIGAVKVHGGEIVGEFSTLVDPGRPIPATITHLTGITTAMVSAAPRISAVLPAFLEFLASADILVAHNAPFDVGFLKAACAGTGHPWPRIEVVDTVKLARAVVPRDEVRNHKLGTLAAHFNASTSPNHRALADARATLDVLHALLGRLGSLGVTTREDLIAFAPKVPHRRRRKAHLAEGLPHGPGVYIFRDERGSPLYVGTSGNVYDRVRTYFTASEKRRNMGAMVDRAATVDAIPCATAVEAHVREIRLIAEHKPPYNRRSKNPERSAWVKFTNEPFPRLSVVRTPQADAVCIGPFRSTSAARAAVDAIHSVRTIRQCTRRLPRTPGTQACSLAELGKCSAPCIGAITPEAYGDDVSALIRAVREETSPLLADVRARLESLSSQERFEEARALRDGVVELLAGLDAYQRSRPLRHNPLFTVARPRSGGGWEFLTCSYGRLAGASVCTPNQDPRSVIAALEATAEAVPAGQTHHPEELMTLLRWLEQDGTRVVTSRTPWSVPIQGATAALPQWRSAARRDNAIRDVEQGSRSR